MCSGANIFGGRQANERIMGNNSRINEPSIGELCRATPAFPHPSCSLISFLPRPRVCERRTNDHVEREREREREEGDRPGRVHTCQTADPKAQIILREASFLTSYGGEGERKPPSFLILLPTLASLARNEEEREREREGGRYCSRGRRWGRTNGTISACGIDPGFRTRDNYAYEVNSIYQVFIIRIRNYECCAFRFSPLRSPAPFFSSVHSGLGWKAVTYIDALSWQQAAWAGILPSLPLSPSLPPFFMPGWRMRRLCVH